MTTLRLGADWESTGKPPPESRPKLLEFVATPENPGNPKSPRNLPRDAERSRKSLRPSATVSEIHNDSQELRKASRETHACPAAPESPRDLPRTVAGSPHSPNPRKPQEPPKSQGISMPWNLLTPPRTSRIPHEPPRILRRLWALSPRKSPDAP